MKEPYYAVIFTSIRTDVENGYDETSQKMEELAKQQPGFLGMDSARNDSWNYYKLLGQFRCY